MSESENIKNTWEKVLEYASSPLHGTMSRKIRKGVTVQINDGEVFDDAQIFISDTFVRMTKTEGDSMINVYYDMAKISAIKTTSTDKA